MELRVQVSGQVPNQAPPMPNSGGIPWSTIHVDREFLRARLHMQEKIFDLLMRRLQCLVTELITMKYRDVARRLEEGLLKSSPSQEEHLNMETLESRIVNCIKRSYTNNHNQQYPHTVSSSPVGMMIPTPGMSHVVNSSMAPTSGGSMASSFMNNGSMNLPGSLHGNSLSRRDGLANGYQQSSTNLSIGFGGNMASMGVQRIASQMIPSPRFTGSNYSCMNVESSNNISGFSNVDSTMVSLSQQKQHVGGQNNNVMHNLGSQIGSGVRPGLQQKSAAYSNGAISSGIGLIRNNMQAVNESGTTDGYAITSIVGIEFGNNFSRPSVGTQSKSAHANQWNSLSHDVNRMTGNTSQEQLVQSDFQQHISRQDEAQYNDLSSDPFIVGQAVASGCSAEPQDSGIAIKKEHGNQQRWLLFLLHARRCHAPEGQCQEQYCHIAQKLCRHIEGCDLTHCTYPRCHPTKVLLRHFKNCKDPCPVYDFVRNYRHSVKRMSQIEPSNNSGMPVGVNESCKSYDTEVPSSSLIPKPAENSEEPQPSQKRLKVDQGTHSSSSNNDNSAMSFFVKCHSDVCKGVQCQDYPRCDTSMPIKSELTKFKGEVLVHSSNENFCEINASNMEGGGHTNEHVTFKDSGLENIESEKETGLDKPVSVSQPSENASGTASSKAKIKGVSLIELFTPEQVREHITSLRQWIGRSKAEAEEEQAKEHSMSQNSCHLCAVERLTFEPPPIYCSICGARIKRNAMYYTMGAGETRHYFCIPCYNEARGDSIVVDGTTIPKVRLEKRKNDEETEESWVGCDKCEVWQHQICALFNGRRNDGGRAEYTCPNCYVQELERGERKPLPQSGVLGAKDLPRTILSDHIEQRLFRELKHERQERARLQGKSYYEVPGAESLVVRVVSSVDKKLEVKQRFLEIFQEENFPTEFPYKSKVILLFQRIEGVEVCLFGMYVQEFGTECQFPNQRRVYLSYLDSVKYFRLEVKAVTGEALRTFVYHEILIGYLEYCKKRGFTSCYIWACPPLKGDDYILYCHPEVQKTPKSNKLREWYLSMLRKAAKDDIVVDLTNLYDHFFVSSGECRAKVTAARLPYFDGDYWPGAAEDLIYQLRQEEDGRKQNKNGIMKKTLTKRALKASGQADLSGNASKDLLLMHKLGETISPLKEDFIMVHLQHPCSHCCILMVFGNRWVCNQCKNFQICDKCYEAEQKLEERERHPINQREKHALNRIKITDVPSDTKDKDEILESEFFDTRQAFLSLCQGNHYQYDTLRRAKHSSMMILYHLHNPTAPAFVTTCNICCLDIETGQGWRCEVCAEYDVCNACYQKGGIDHPHKLTNYPSLADNEAQNKEARQI